MNYLLDTKALIAFFNNEDGADKVEVILKEIDETRAGGFISAITITELYYLYSRRIGERVAKERIEQLRRSNLQIVPINEDIAMRAGEYKIQAIPIADALIAASAYLIDAPVVTDDEHFEEVNVQVLRFRGHRSKKE
ncbi:MAG: type II toxin-antitoxin system VapC family toxin [Methanophagales archaeon ANME-1-THS]|nr:MAG: type II toxin-antitoxin system VapC family toxin [Methanophagales archaeon ANME-1-THS]